MKITTQIQSQSQFIECFSVGQLDDLRKIIYSSFEIESSLVFEVELFNTLVNVGNVYFHKEYKGNVIFENYVFNFLISFDGNEYNKNNKQKIEKMKFNMLRLDKKATLKLIVKNNIENF
jgi:hypothetical protein